MVSKQENEAATYLDYYLDEALETDYAVMLCAPWGAGKTHFITSYLKARSERMPKKRGPRHLYVSLFGVTSTSAISDQFFAQIHPRINSKPSKVVGSFLSGVVEKFSGTKNSGQMLRDILLRLKGKILVIDDLERCPMKIAEVMGFINTFVEHRKLKVIILANESEIPENQLDDYKRQKEKLVGKTIEVKADPTEVLEKLIGDIRSDTVKKIVSGEKVALLATFNAPKKPNYRNLRAVLADFERLVSVVDERLRQAPGALRQLLLYMVATGCAVRCADLTEDNLRNLPTTSLLRHLFGRTTKTPTEQEFERFQNRYPEVRWTDPIIHPGHLADLIFSGKIAVDDINEGLARHPAVVGDMPLPAWRMLWDWPHRGRAEYERAKAELLRELATEQLVHPAVILHVAGIAITLKANSAPILGEDISIEAYFTDYVARLVVKGTLLPDTGPNGFDSMTGAGLGYSSYTDPEFQSIYTMVKNACAEVGRRQMEKVASEYVERLDADPESYSSLYEHGVYQGNYGATPFLQHIAVDEFARLVIVESQWNDRLSASLVKRYENDSHRQMLRAEYDWLEMLKARLLVLADDDTPPFSELLNKRVSYYFDMIDEGIGRSVVQS